MGVLISGLLKEIIVTQFIKVGSKKPETLEEYIIALRETGIYVQPRSTHNSNLILSEQRKFIAEMSFDDNCINFIKDLMESRLVEDAVELAEARSMDLDDYVQELRNQVVCFEYPGELSFIDESNPLCGLIWKREWCTDPSFDPVYLEFYFNDVLRKFFTKSEVEIFERAFENYWASEYPELFGQIRGQLNVFGPFLDNEGFYEELFDWKSKHGRSAAEKFEKLVMDSVYAPFSEYCSFEFSSDYCYFTIGKSLFYTAIVGLRTDKTIDICIFDGSNS